MRAYRFHVANPTARYDVEWGRVVTLCHKDYPEAYVFDAPVKGQPMCPECLHRYERMEVSV